MSVTGSNVPKTNTNRNKGIKNKERQKNRERIKERDQEGQEFHSVNNLLCVVNKIRNNVLWLRGSVRHQTRWLWEVKCIEVPLTQSLFPGNIWDIPSSLANPYWSCLHRDPEKSSHQRFDTVDIAEIIRVTQQFQLTLTLNLLSNFTRIRWSYKAWMGE